MDDHPSPHANMHRLTCTGYIQILPWTRPALLRQHHLMEWMTLARAAKKSRSVQPVMCGKESNLVLYVLNCEVLQVEDYC